MKLSMDLENEGLLMFFKEWQLETLRVFWKLNKPLGTKEIWDEVGGNKVISRASIINFLNLSVENGLLNIDYTTGKGGHRGIYSIKYDEEETREYLKKQFSERLDVL